MPFLAREKKMLIIPGGLAEKIDSNRGDMSRAEFLDYCIDRCLGGEEAEEAPGVSREKFERLKAEVDKVRTVGQRILEKLETVDDLRGRLDRVMVDLEMGPRGEERPSRVAVTRLVEERRWEASTGGLVLVDWDDKLGPVVRRTYPPDWRLEDRLDEEMITAVYTLNVMSQEQTEHMRLEFKDSKVAGVARREGSVVLLVLDPDQDLPTYREGILRMAAELGRAKDWEEALPDLYQKYLQRPS